MIKIKRRYINLIIISRRYLSWFMLLIAFLIFSLLSKNFYEFSNLIAIIRGASIYGIIACGLTVVLISGGFDLSIGAAVGLVSLILTRQIIAQKFGFFTMLLFPLSVSILIAYINGFLFQKIKIPVLIVTLSMMSILNGIRLSLYGGYNDKIIDMPKWLSLFGKEFLGPIPVSVIIFIIVAIISSVILNKTLFGRHVYIVGADEKAARLSGIKVENIRILSFMYLGVLIFIATLCLLGRVGGYSFSLGNNYEIEVLFAVVLGGVSLMGGSGTIDGCIVGVLLIATLRNGLTIVGVNYSSQEMIVGTIFIVFVIIQINLVKTFIKKRVEN